MIETPVNIDISNTDWELLREQKIVLLDQIAQLRKNDANSFEALQLEGIISWMDFIQDQVAEQLGEEKVFGKL